MKSFDRADTIFRNEDVLREDWRPDAIIGRDDEMTKYHDALQPVIRGAQPLNIFLYGKTGVGKTVATELILDQLQDDAADYDDLDVTVEYLRCNSLNSSYQVVAHLINSLKPDGEEIATTGYDQQTLFNILWDELDRIGGTVLIVLDEIDNIGTDDDILYELPRARANGYVTAAKPGVIGISNDFKFRDRLSPKVKDSLCDEEIEFPPYGADQLIEILEDRAGQAFQDDALDDGVVPLCAGIAARDSGSARQALRLLYQAGTVAANQDAPQVTEAHVREAEDQLQREEIADKIRDLTTHAHLILAAVVKHHVQGGTPLRTREIYPAYQELAHEAGIDPLVLRRMRDHLSELALYSVLDRRKRNDGYNKGSYHEFSLAIPVETAVDVLESITRVRELEIGLRGLAERNDAL